jgi:uncharacterized membrane protein YcaP (DUF421 family)
VGTILRAAVVYWFLLLMLRLLGRRSMAQMTPFELILMFLMGGMSIQAVVSDDRSMTNALLAVATVAVMHLLVSVLKQRSERFQKIVDGTPLIVVDDGRWKPELMSMCHIQELDVMQAARQQGIQRAEQIRYAIVERNGSISIVRQE